MSRRLADRINQMSGEDAYAAFLGCCGSNHWARQMTASRPYETDERLWAEANASFAALSDTDWHEALEHHPKIGDLKGLRAKFVGNRKWSASEQSGIFEASDAILTRLAESNEVYLQKFGYIFVVCATGKSAEEMLVLLESRLPNDPRDELRIAAAEQRTITKLRLEKLERE